MRMPSSSHSTFLLAAAATVACQLLFAASGARSQDAALARVQFTASGQDGRPIVDLAANDVTLRVGGRVREIRSLELVRSEPGGAAALPEPFATNAAPARAGRNVLVVFDEESITPGREAPLRESILQLVSALGPADRVRLLSTREGGANLELTDRSGASGAVARFTGFSSPDETEDRLICRSRNALQLLESVLRSYAGQPPPTVVMIFGGFGAPSTGGAGRLGVQGPCPVLRTTEFGDIGAAAEAVGARVYVINAVDATASKLSRNMLATGVEALAGAMSAELINLVNVREAAMKRIAEDTSVYYVASFAPDAGERAQRVEIQVSRPGAKVRAQSATIAAAASAGGKAPSPNDMLRGATPYRDLPLRAAGFASRGEGDKIRLVVLFESQEPGTKLTGAAVGLYDAKGKLTRWTADSADLARSPAMGGIIVPAGTYRMRVAAVDAAGRAGTVDTEVKAELQSVGAVKVSGMMLGVSGSDAAFAPRLQFENEKGAFAYFEIYGVQKAVPSVRLEIAQSADGPALVSDDAPLTNGPSGDVRVAYSGYDIQGLPPGDVVMRALVSIDGKPAGRLVRTLRKIK